MKLTTQNGITTRQDGLPYDYIKTSTGYDFRATGGATSVVIASCKTELQALHFLISQAPEDAEALRRNQIAKVLNSPYISDSEKAQYRKAVGA